MQPSVDDVEKIAQPFVRRLTEFDDVEFLVFVRSGGKLLSHGHASVPMVLSSMHMLLGRMLENHDDGYIYETTDREDGQ